MSRTTRYCDDTRCAGADPLEGSHHQKHREVAGERRSKRTDDVDRETEEKHRAAPKMVGDRAVDELREPEEGDVRRYRQLPRVLVGDQQAFADLLQCGEDDVDRHGVQRHQKRHHRDKLDMRHSRGRVRGDVFAHVCFHSRRAGGAISVARLSVGFLMRSKG